MGLELVELVRSGKLRKLVGSAEKGEEFNLARLGSLFWVSLAWWPGEYFLRFHHGPINAGTIAGWTPFSFRSVDTLEAFAERCGRLSRALQNLLRLEGRAALFERLLRLKHEAEESILPG